MNFNVTTIAIVAFAIYVFRDKIPGVGMSSASQTINVASGEN